MANADKDYFPSFNGKPKASADYGRLRLAVKRSKSYKYPFQNPYRHLAVGVKTVETNRVNGITTSVGNLFRKLSITNRARFTWINPI